MIRKMSEEKYHLEVDGVPLKMGKTIVLPLEHFLPISSTYELTQIGDENNSWILERKEDE